MQQYNIPAITVEIGDPARFQKRFVKSAILGVTNILSHLKMVEDEHEVQDYDPVVCAKSVRALFCFGSRLYVMLTSLLLSFCTNAACVSFFNIHPQLVLDIHEGRRNIERPAGCEYVGAERRIDCNTTQHLWPGGAPLFCT